MTLDMGQCPLGKAGFRGLRVAAKIVESSLITSFHLEAADGTALPAFRPGQFLVFKIPSGDPKGHVLRNYSLSGAPEHQAFDPLEAMRTPYRIDILQPLYFVLPDLKQLFDLAQQDIMAMVREAMRLGLHQPKFPPKAA